MDQNERISAEFLITGKHDYKESSLIVNGFSPDFGRVDFVQKGGRRLGKKEFSAVDLFNVYEVAFIFRETGLLNISSSVMIEEFSNIAQDYSAFEFAARLLKFINSNCQFNIPQPGTFNCLYNILSLLAASSASDKNNLLFEVVFKLTFLYENGLLPDSLDSDEKVSNKKYKKVIEIIQSGESGFQQMPQVSEDGWRALLNWVNALSSFHQLKDF